MSNKTAEITITGEPDQVQAIIARLREILDITYESKPKPIRFHPGHIQITLRSRPLVISQN